MRDYIEDELAREGYRRRCARWEPGLHVCDWSGRAQVHLESSPRSLRATMREAEPAPVAVAAPVPPAASPPPRTATGPASARDMEAMARALAKPATPAPARSATPVFRDTLREEVEPGLPRDTTAAGPGHVPVSIATLPIVDSCVAVRPEAARRAGVYGTVLVKVVIDSTGAVSSASVVRGVPELDRAALECARRYRFQSFAAFPPPDHNDRLITIRFIR